VHMVVGSLEDGSLTVRLTSGGYHIVSPCLVCKISQNVLLL